MIGVAHIAEAVGRFGLTKHADLATIIPAVAAPALGGYFGRQWTHGSELGALIGGVTGGVAGQYIREELPRWRSGAEVPAGAPYALDPSSQDIPPWALAGAQLLRPAVKAAAAPEHEGWKDIIFGDTLGPLYPLGQGLRNRDLGGALRGIAGQGVGVAGGGLAGYGAGKLLARAVGRDINLPGVNIPLSTILSGLGATVGGVKGLQYARSLG
jgi:hypothetical protein